MNTRSLISISVSLLLLSCCCYTQMQVTKLRINADEQVEPQIAIDPVNALNAVAFWQDAGWPGLNQGEQHLFRGTFSITTNGGTNWSAPDTLPLAPPPTPENMRRYNCDPSVAIDRNGNIYFCILYGNPSLPAWEAWVAKRTITNPGWTIKSVVTGGTGGTTDRPYITVDNTGTTTGRIFVAWKDNRSGHPAIKFNYTDDFSQGFPSDSQRTLYTEYGSFSPTGTQTYTVRCLTVGIHLVFVYSAHSQKIYFRKTLIRLPGNLDDQREIATCAGSTDYFPTGGSGTIFLDSYPAIAAIDAPIETFHVVYADKVNGQWKVYYKKSSTQGITWTDKTPVNGFTTGWEFQPSITFDQHKVSIAFYTSADSLHADYKVVESLDDGEHFTAASSISSPSFDPTSGQTSRNDYQGYASRSGLEYAIWAGYGPTDAADVYVCRIKTVVAPIVGDWNMVGVPNFVADRSKIAVYPTSTSDASRWDPNTGQWIVTDPLSVGGGYWLGFPSSPGTVSTTGSARYTGLFQVTYGAASYWNLVGSVSKDVPTSSMTQSPPNIVVFPIYRYDHGYCATNTLYAGLGFWVKVRASGWIGMPSSPPKMNGDIEPFSSLDKFIVADASGCKQEMFVRNTAGSSVDGYPDDVELPPPPPNVFDARFVTNNYVQSVSPQNGTTLLSIVTRNVTPPITISWDIKPYNGMKYSLIGSSSRTELTGTGISTISSLEQGSISIEATAGTAMLPASLSLSQNSPNPFNPETHIEYAIPERSSVQLVVFDVLGREVATLVDEVQDAGYKTVRFDANNLSSGIYFYRLTAGRFTDVKKMLLLK